VSEGTYFAAEEDSRPETERLRLLEAIFDPGTIGMLGRTGVRPGWRCFVPGAGHGSIARWLADQVAPSGCVVAADIDTRFLAASEGPNLEVRQHDLLVDPLESGSYDLAHTRLLLMHLPGRQQEAIDRLVGAIRPGGWLAVDELDVANLGSADPAHPSHQTITEVVETVLTAARAHLDLFGGRHVAAMLARHPDLTDVTTNIAAMIERGGTPHCRYLAQTLGIVSSTLDGQVSKVSAQLLTDALSGDPSLLFVTELRYQIVARKVAAEG
jgi:SAM-dependent methyltransferase